MSTTARRGLGTALAVTAATAGLALAGIAPASAASVHPATSSLDGTISASEVITRGDDWTHHHFAYDQSHYQIDLNHDHSYRLDCSGYADMMLHLGSDFNTDDFAHHASENMAFEYAPGVSTGTASTINPKTVHTGDLFDDTSDGHMFVFGKWASDGKSFTYYSFGYGYTDQNVKMTGHPGDAQLGYETRSHYRVIRYKRVTA